MNSHAPIVLSISLLFGVVGGWQGAVPPDAGVDPVIRPLESAGAGPGGASTNGQA